jgi:hypothetical protein
MALNNIDRMSIVSIVSLIVIITVMVRLRIQVTERYAPGVETIPAKWRRK